MESYVKDIYLHNNSNYGLNKIGFDLSPMLDKFSKLEYIPKNTLSIKIIDDNPNQEFFDNKKEAIQAIEMNRYEATLNYNFNHNITILSVYVDIIDLIEIRRLKIKGILQDYETESV
jgi:hypothetical protein